jgi:2-polyprenyl-3-methyl-5-hydroxy-6-metoxy-1,4-benzoquinol methylase
MDRNDWNTRYQAQDLLWGVEPNSFVAAEFGKTLPRGRVLDVGCGEGRNAIWLASLGWTVTGVDFSDVALERARRLAAHQNVDVEWIEADVTAFEPPRGVFRLVIISYLQIPGDERRAVLAHAVSALEPGGTLFMIGHALLNLTEGAGGPRDAEVLWEPAEIHRELAAQGLSIERVEQVRRPFETPEGEKKEAIDTLARAKRPG